MIWVQILVLVNYKYLLQVLTNTGIRDIPLCGYLGRLRYITDIKLFIGGINLVPETYFFFGFFRLSKELLFNKFCHVLLCCGPNHPCLLYHKRSNCGNISQIFDRMERQQELSIAFLLNLITIHYCTLTFLLLYITMLPIIITIYYYAPPLLLLPTIPPLLLLSIIVLPIIITTHYCPPYFSYYPLLSFQLLLLPITAPFHYYDYLLLHSPIIITILLLLLPITMHSHYYYYQLLNIPLLLLFITVLFHFYYYVLLHSPIVITAHYCALPLLLQSITALS